MGTYSLFNLLKSLVSEIKDYTSEVSYYQLKAMSLCISIWHGSCIDTEDVKFVEKLVDIIKENTMTKLHDTNVWRIEIVAKTVELTSLYLFVSRRECKNCESKIFALLNSAEFLKSLESKFKINQRDEKYIKLVSEKFSKFTGGKYKLDQFIRLESIQEGGKLVKNSIISKH